jgi:hypothetical protein
MNSDNLVGSRDDKVTPMCVPHVAVSVFRVGCIVLLGLVSTAADCRRRVADNTADAKLPDTLRMADGRPSLEGIWSFANMTPLQRPVQFAAKPLLTDEEVAEFEEYLKREADESPSLQIAYDPRVWQDRGRMSRRTSLIVDPSNGRMPPLTADGQSRAPRPTRLFAEHAGTDGPEDRLLGERCILGRPAGPPLRPETYNNTVQIFQTGRYVALLNEMIHNARIVPLVRREPLGVRQWTGESVGHWDGDVLVIETTNFRGDSAAFIGFGASEELRLTERIRRVDRDTLSYEFTVNDPKTWIAQWTAEFPLTKERAMYELACHEGNYGMFGILRAARAEDKARAGRGDTKGEVR